MAPQMQSSLRTHRERRRSWRTPSSPPAGFTLALGGGAARGWSHVGVLRALEEGGLRPRRIVGTSMGALVGLFAAADKLEALHAAGLALDRRALLSFLDVAIPRAGLIDGKRLRALLREHLGPRAVSPRVPRGRDARGRWARQPGPGERGARLGRGDRGRGREIPRQNCVGPDRILVKCVGHQSLRTTKNS